MEYEEERGSPFYLSQPRVYGSCCLFSTMPPSKYKRKPGLIWSTNKVANTKCLSDRRAAAAMLSAALLLTSNKSLMGDRDLLSSKWDTINALVFLINDVGYENRDKLTLLAALRARMRACACVLVCAHAKGGRRWREGERVRLQAALKSVYSLRWALRG